MHHNILYTNNCAKLSQVVFIFIQPSINKQQKSELKNKLPTGFQVVSLIDTGLFMIFMICIYPTPLPRVGCDTSEDGTQWFKPFPKALVRSETQFRLTFEPGSPSAFPPTLRHACVYFPNSPHDEKDETQLIKIHFYFSYINSRKKAQGLHLP